MNHQFADSDYLSVKAFAELVGITPASLRHYDRAGVFSPAKRGTEDGNQYRFYSPTQITTVKMIRVLTEIGVPIDTIHEMSQSRTPEKLLKLLRKHGDRVADEIRFLKEVYSIINTFSSLLYESISISETEITVSQMPEKRIILGKENDFSGTRDFVREFIRFCNGSHKPKLNLSYPVGGYFENMMRFMFEPSRPTCFFSLDPKGHERKEAGLYLVGYTRGYYGQTNDLPARLDEFAKKNGLIFNGPVYNLFLTDEVSEMDPDKYLLQVTASVSETRRTPTRRPRRQYEGEASERRKG